MFKRPVVVALLFLLISPAAIRAGEVSKGPNVTFDNSELEPFGPAPGKDSDRLVFYQDEKVVFGVNEDAQADLGMPF
jgi:hypothetical protein